MLQKNSFEKKRLNKNMQIFKHNFLINSYWLYFFGEISCKLQSVMIEHHNMVVSKRNFKYLNITGL